MARPIKILAKTHGNLVELWQKEDGEKYVLLATKNEFAKIFTVQEFLLIVRTFNAAEREIYRGD